MRDRGDAINRQNDLQGALGELLGLRLLEESLPEGHAIQHCLVDLEGSIDECDLVVTTSAGTVKYEVKCHFDESKKKYLAINERAYERSERRGAQGFIPMITRPGLQRVCVGSMIRIEEVGQWPVLNLRNEVNPDRAFCSPISAMRDTFGANFGQIRTALHGSGTVTTDQLLDAVDM